MTRWVTHAMQALMLLALAAAPTARAQAAPDERVMGELRMDVIGAERRTSLHLGGGLQIPAGYYVRIGIIGAAGADVVSDGRENSARLEVIGRFLFDPFRQNQWGLSAGAGVGLRVRAGDRARPALLAVVDLEGPRSGGGFAPAFQVGLGGGVRVGAALRWGARAAR